MEDEMKEIKEEKRPEQTKKEEEIKIRKDKETRKQTVSLNTRQNYDLAPAVSLKKLNQEFRLSARKIS